MTKKLCEKNWAMQVLKDDEFYQEITAAKPWIKTHTFSYGGHTFQYDRVNDKTYELVDDN